MAQLVFQIQYTKNAWPFYSKTIKAVTIINEVVKFLTK